MEVPMIPAGIHADEAVLQLMKMAESFRSEKTPRYRLAIKCLMAALKIPCTKELAAHVGFSMGKMLWYYTKNSRMARLHLEHAYKFMKELGDSMTVQRLEVVCLVGEIYIFERKYEQIVSILKAELEISRNYPEIHARLLFLMAEIYMKLRNYDKALDMVRFGVEYFSKLQNVILVCYFLLVKCLIYCVHSCQAELGQAVADLSEILLKIPPETSAAEDIRAFCYSIQLSFFLSAGFFKNAKSCLRHLQGTVQLASRKEPETSSHFRWLSPEMLTAVAYVITVLTNIQFNNIDRARRYFQTSIKHFDNLRQLWRQSSFPVIEWRHCDLADHLEVLVYEAIAPTFLITGQPEDCISNVQRMRELLWGKQMLTKDFEAPIHCILGMYATYFQEYDIAEKNYLLAAELSSDNELKMFCFLSLGLVYLCTLKTVPFYEMYEKITPLQPSAKNMRALVLFVNAFQTYIHNRGEDCKNHILQSLNISKDEDMGRLQALSSLLLSTLLKAKDKDALTTGYDWAVKLDDLSLQCWGCKQKLEFAKQTEDSAQVAEAQTKLSALQEKLERGRKTAQNSRFHKILKEEFPLRQQT